jgi:hypothetical protein
MNSVSIYEEYTIHVSVIYDHNLVFKILDVFAYVIGLLVTTDPLRMVPYCTTFPRLHYYKIY